MGTRSLCLRDLRLHGAVGLPLVAAVAAGRPVRDSQPVGAKPPGMPGEDRGRAQGGFLTGAWVLVTGAASGIGLAVTARCLSEGAAVARP